MTKKPKDKAKAENLEDVAAASPEQQAQDESINVTDGQGSKEEQPKEPQAEIYTLSQKELNEARSNLEKLQKEKDETVALLQRNQADFDNYRKRNQSLRKDSYDEGRRDTIKALLGILDDFDRIIESSAGQKDQWLEGVKMVHRKLTDELAKMGVEVIDTDCEFDPRFHNAVMMEKVEGKESGSIIAVFQKGYRIGDKILRYSMVKVAE
ncbi:MAG TPA: nucleotide exchange factor GrpE [Eubacteriales bacterium]|nr:nucleotide exchange factor GrpE [Clostridia bacterium]HRV72617.1 nucleotide exchange factor GrpE [Eubacteriales bacterium]